MADDLTAEQLDYIKRITKRVRWSDLAMNSRSVGHRFVWIVVLVAGAAITLAEATIEWGWLPPLLGFVIVVAQGLDRILSRDTDGAKSMEHMRRSLGQEVRTFHAGVGPYQDVVDRFPLFAERCEEVLAGYDREAVEHIERSATAAS